MLGFKTWRALRRRGVIGINQRNSDYVLALNKRKHFPLVDDKVRTKQLALDAGLQVPEQYGVISTEQGIPRIEQIADKHGDFVIKPAQGAGGDGILVITDRFQDYYRSASGRLVSREEIGFHLSGIISGLYSLGGQRDKALIEYRVQPTDQFDSISVGGVPDIRIIVLKGFPLLAMVRLPTQQSDGKANLHQGAIGVGVDIATGRTLAGTWNDLQINHHPDTANPVAGVRISDWQACLELATGFYDLTGLGYLGVDLVLDRHRGPLMLELNARAGLRIQIANNDGMLRRAHIVQEFLDAQGADAPLPPVTERVRLAQQWFAHEQLPAMPEPIVQPA